MGRCLKILLIGTAQGLGLILLGAYIPRVQLSNASERRQRAGGRGEVICMTGNVASVVRRSDVIGSSVLTYNYQFLTS